MNVTGYLSDYWETEAPSLRAITSLAMETKSVRRHRRYNKLLETVQIGSAILDVVGDGASIIPGLKCATNLVNQVVHVALTVNVNKDVCDELVEDICAYLDRIKRVLLVDEGFAVSPTFYADVLLFKRELKEVLEFLHKLSCRKYHIWFLQHSSDKRTLEDYGARLKRAREHLNLAGTMETQIQLHEISRSLATVRRTVKHTSDSLDLFRASVSASRPIPQLGIMSTPMIACCGRDDPILPNTPDFDAAEFIRLMTSTKVLWKRTALALTTLVDQSKPCYHGRSRIWLEAKVTARLIHEWPEATRALIWTSWEEDRFQVMVELCDADFAPSVTRYEYFWIEAADLSGRQGAASVDENSEDEMKAWMDSQMNMPWNLHAVDLSCWHENDAMRY